MKRCSITTSPTTAILSGCWVVFTIVLLILVLTGSTADAPIIPAVIMLGVFDIPGIFLLTYGIISYRRYRIARKGKKAIGVVRESYYSIGRNARYHLEISYKTEGGEDAVLYASPSPSLAHYFEIGRKVPILVNGNYAVYDLPELQRGSNFSDEKDYKYCPSCGARLDKEDRFCKHCGTSLNE